MDPAIYRGFLLFMVLFSAYEALRLWRRHVFLQECAKSGEYEKCEILFEATN